MRAWVVGLLLVGVGAKECTVSAEGKQVCAEDSDEHVDKPELVRRKVKAFEEGTDRIFVSIAAFMDPELVPTVENLLENAKWPEKLDFGILLQEKERSEFEWENLPNFNVWRIDALQSRGVGWARHTGAQLYKGQRYLLQLDSHHRFAKDWDKLLVEELAMCEVYYGTTKPILSTYVTPYTPNARRLDNSIRKVVTERYYDSGKLRFVASPTWGKAIDKPQPAAVISAHFIFTYGTWLAEVPYDELIYFDGEEDTLSARSWTHGWDIFFPHRAIVWHLYGREGMKKHWDVHPEWWLIKRNSEARVRQILEQEPTDTDFGVYGMGTTRSFEAFQEFSGFYFPKWHLGVRATTGDVTIRETNPPPDKSDKSIVGRCLYRGSESVFVDMGFGKWEERTNKNEVYNFIAASQKSKNQELVLFDAARGMYIELTRQKASWGHGPSADKVEGWTMLQSIQNVKCY
eukprot:c16350_g1_i2.p1 GENE.c16350_g1_i2~~c16350_g1_i2.p1  ORF type:complete len:459 (+),score=108.05 c16350_g1_i2:45-1421(+)